jgi:DNA helicase-2/ATP-dependent DNA helicase PcrA
VTRRIDKPDTAADIELRGYLDADVRSCFVMMAGAGSGKTTSLVKALDHIGKKHGAELRRRGQRVACITYTNIAVEEIRGDVGDQVLFYVSTIHSFLWEIVKPFQRDIALWVKERIEEKLLKLHGEVAKFGPRVKQKKKDDTARSIGRLDFQLSRISGVKLFKYGSDRDDKYGGGHDYSKGILGHDDIVNMVPQLIKSRPLLREIIAQRFPFVFVDESQDTLPDVVDAFRGIAQYVVGRFCLGFFGDPMQKIYLAGAGDIALDVGWRRITKSENFRCPSTVLSVINKIRSEVDELQQICGRSEVIDGRVRAVPGTVQLFVLPANNERSKNLDRVRDLIAHKHSDPEWTNDAPESGVRILVIAHRMAAARLGFGDLYAAFYDSAPESFKNGFREGAVWALKPFLDVLLPICKAVDNGRQFELMALLRTYCPQLSKDALEHVDDVASLLRVLKSNTSELATLMSDSTSATLYDVLRFVSRTRLIALDERFEDYVREDLGEAPGPGGFSSPELDGEGDDKEDLEATAIGRGLACSAKQIRRYSDYVNDLSLYSTQQGVKGAEFERVVVVLDDEEAKYGLFSYDKLLGLKASSKVDDENKVQGKETVFDRTRRLFYVCCSRATKDLAVVLYSEDVAKAAEQLKKSAMFLAEDVYTLDDVERWSADRLQQ